MADGFNAGGSATDRLPPGLVVVALGSNLGNSREILPRALEELKKFAAGQPGSSSASAGRVFFQASSFYQTEPVDCPPDSPPFLNAVAIFSPARELTPEILLERLQALEREFGRLPKTVMNEPRTLDLDIIAFGEERRETARLTLPHPRAHLRQFVLAPLREIAPDYILPGQQKTIAELCGK